MFQKIEDSKSEQIFSLAKAKLAILWEFNNKSCKTMLTSSGSKLQVIDPNVDNNF